MITTDTTLDTALAEALVQIEQADRLPPDERRALYADAVALLEQVDDVARAILERFGVE